MDVLCLTLVHRNSGPTMGRETLMITPLTTFQKPTYSNDGALQIRKRSQYSNGLSLQCAAAECVPRYQKPVWVGIEKQVHRNGQTPSLRRLISFIDLEPEFKAMSMGQSSGQMNEDPFTDTSAPPSAHTSIGRPYSRMNASNPEFIPRGLTKAPLPAVKGTQSFTPRFPLQPQADNAMKQAQINNPAQVDQGRYQETHAQAPATTTGKAANLRDQVPFTGFPTSKQDQLKQSLSNVIEESKASGDLSASNRSVLFDPVAAGGSSYNTSSNTRPGSRINPEGKHHSCSLHIPRIAHTIPYTLPEHHFSFVSDTFSSAAQAPVSPANSLANSKCLTAAPFNYGNSQEPMRTTRPTNYSNLLDSSEPLPSAYRRGEILDGIPITSPGDHRLYQNPYASVPPQYPPGLDPEFQKKLAQGFSENMMHNRDGLYSESFASNSGNAWIESFVNPPPGPSKEQIERDAINFFNPPREKQDQIKNILLRESGLAPLPPAYDVQRVRPGHPDYQWEFLKPKDPDLHKKPDVLVYPQEPQHKPNFSGSNLPPIGSERRSASQTQNPPAPGATGPNSTLGGPFVLEVMSKDEQHKRQAIDIFSGLITTLHDYKAGDSGDYGARFSDPPAWAIDNGPGGNKSLFDPTWKEVPKRVGRDPRYQGTMHEGRMTYFENLENLSGGDRPQRGRPLGPNDRPTPGWGRPNPK